MRFFEDFFKLFYPNLCENCQVKLVNNETILCVFCRHDLPLTKFTNYTKNKVFQSFYGKVEIEKVTSLLYYRKKGATKKLIHQLKYRGNEEIGVFFGNWLGEILKENNQFSDVDYIVPVPIHAKKMKQRGYNQLTKFGKTLNTILNIPFIENNLIRVSASKTQTLKSRFERFSNTETKFFLNDTLLFKNKHILLIDDVITTGATLKSCAEELQKSTSIKISILTIAYTE